jgi:hypothetical protein
MHVGMKKDGYERKKISLLFLFSYFLVKMGSDSKKARSERNRNIILSHGWCIPTIQADQAKNISAKFKNLRKIFRNGQKSIPTLKTNITNVKDILLFIEIIEDYRDLTLAEWNFREILGTKLNGLLDQQKIYWRQRGAIKWAQLGDTNTVFSCKCFYRT